MSSNVRVRYAPSPTGYLHVGGVRTLLFNWLYARHTGGKLILRVEDTDQKRSTRESELQVLETIRMLGIHYDEGPETGGSHEPYRQSERFEIYADHAKKLFDEGKAYFCFCSPELIGQKREVALKLGKIPVYDGTCSGISRDDASKRVASGEKAGLRFRVPKGRTYTIDDCVRDRVEFQSDHIGDFMITRAPTPEERVHAHGVGMPVYNFACVIDDHLMQMSHILRGEDHLSNTSRQLIIYEAFGWTPPRFGHIAMVLGSDRQKLSKRNGDVSAIDYLDKGYFPETLLNFLVLLGWWPPNDFKPASGHPEILTVEEMARVFSLDAFQKSPAVFDLQKLAWMNSFYMKMLPIDRVMELGKKFLDVPELRTRDKAWIKQAVEVVRGECTVLGDLPQALSIFFDENAHLSDEGKKWLTEGAGPKVVETLASELARASDSLGEDEVGRIQQAVGAASGAKGKPLFMAIRVAATGRTSGPELKRVLPLMGKTAVLKRLQNVRSQAGI